MTALHRPATIAQPRPVATRPLWVVEQCEGEDCSHLYDYATKADALKAAAKAIARPGRFITKVVVWKNAKVQETEV
jgi:hypothetical protein